MNNFSEFSYVFTIIMTHFKDIIKILIYLVFTVYIIFPSKDIITIIKNKSKKIRNEIKKTSENFKLELLNNIDGIIIDCIQSTNQTFVDNLKKDSLFTKEKANEAFDITYNHVFELVSKDLEPYYDSKQIETIITNKIERLVKDLHM